MPSWHCWRRVATALVPVVRPALPPVDRFPTSIAFGIPYLAISVVVPHVFVLLVVPTVHFWTCESLNRYRSRGLTQAAPTFSVFHLIRARNQNPWNPYPRKLSYCVRQMQRLLSHQLRVGHTTTERNQHRWSSDHWDFPSTFHAIIGSRSETGKAR